MKNQINKEKVLYILQSFKEKAGKCEDDWILMKAKLHLLMFNIDKEAFLSTGKKIFGFTYIRKYIPMINDNWFNEVIKELYSDLYNTQEDNLTIDEYSIELAKKMKR